MVAAVCLADAGLGAGAQEEVAVGTGSEEVAVVRTVMAMVAAMVVVAMAHPGNLRERRHLRWRQKQQ